MLSFAVLDHLRQDLRRVHVVVTLKLNTLELLFELSDSELTLLRLKRGDLLSLVLALDVSLLASPLAARFEQMGADSPQRCSKSRLGSVLGPTIAALTSTYLTHASTPRTLA